MRASPYLNAEEKEIAVRALDKDADTRARGVKELDKLSKHPNVLKGLLKNLMNDESASVRVAAKALWVKLKFPYLFIDP